MHTNISDMPAGRKLDLQIAREVFGHFRAYNVWRYSTRPLRYSTGIAAAWKIVDIFRHGWNGHAAACIQIEMWDVCYEGNDCCISIDAPDISKVSGWADTAPLAICRAALEIVERCKEAG